MDLVWMLKDFLWYVECNPEAFTVVAVGGIIGILLVLQVKDSLMCRKGGEQE